MAIFRGLGGSASADVGGATELQNVTGVIRAPTLIEFASDSTIAPAARQLTWNATTQTLDLGLNESVSLQIGEEVVYQVYNQSATIPKGSLCKAVGTTGVGGKFLVEVWDGVSPAKTILGVASESITSGSTGYVTRFGILEGIPTDGAAFAETWADGDTLYPGVLEGFSNTLPAAPRVKTPIATVILADATNGILFVNPQYTADLSGIDSVELTNLQDGEILRYNASTQRFENINPASVEGFSVVTISTDPPSGGNDNDIWFQIT